MSSSNLNEKAKLNAKYGKCHMASVYGEMLISKDIASALKSPLDDESYADTDSFHVTGWQKLPPHLLALTVQEFQEVMDDGLANGFEFRLQGSTILYREVQH